MIREGNSFKTYTDLQGNPLITFNKDGSISQTDGKNLAHRYYDVVQVPTAAVLTLNSNPFVIVPGLAGFVPNLKSLYIRYNFGTQVFNPTSNDFLNAVIGSGANALLNNIVLTSPTVGFVDQTQNMALFYDTYLQAQGPGFSGSNSVALSSLSGSAIKLIQYRKNMTFPAGVDWTQGDGSLTVFVEYVYMRLS